MTSQLTKDDYRAVARILYTARQRRLARLAAEQAGERENRRDPQGGGTDAR